jgi:hypothetical protein
MDRMFAVKGAEFFDFQATRRPALIFCGRIVFIFALSALKLDNVSGHKSPY